jgi:excisionase family DNA binding protein
MQTLKHVDHLEKRLGTNKPQTYKLIREGVIPPPVVIRVGRQYRVNADALEEWIEAGGAGYSGGWRKGGGEAEATG